MDQPPQTPKLAKLRSKLAEYGRVLRITKKPTVEEFKTTAKVTAIGLAIIGLIGFAINIAVALLKTALK